MTDAHVTNEALSDQLAALTVEVRRGPEVTAAIVHQAITEHVGSIPHSGISMETAEFQIERLKQMGEIQEKLVDLIDGPKEPDWRGTLVHQPEKGLLARLARIEEQTNGATRKLDPKAWTALLATFAATVYQIIATWPPGS